MLAQTGEISDALRVEMEKHLNECRDCAKYAVDLRRITDLTLQETRVDHVPDEVMFGILQMARATAGLRSAKDIKAWSFRLFPGRAKMIVPVDFRRFAFYMAACLLVVAGIWAFIIGENNKDAMVSGDLASGVDNVDVVYYDEIQSVTSDASGSLDDFLFNTAGDDLFSIADITETDDKAIDREIFLLYGMAI